MAPAQVLSPLLVAAFDRGGHAAAAQVAGAAGVPAAGLCGIGCWWASWRSWGGPRGKCCLPCAPRPSRPGIIYRRPPGGAQGHNARRLQPRLITARASRSQTRQAERRIGPDAQHGPPRQQRRAGAGGDDQHEQPLARAALGAERRPANIIEQPAPGSAANRGPARRAGGRASQRDATVQVGARRGARASCRCASG